jgi:homoserine/homoserine lactone efflux protein
MTWTLFFSVSLAAVLTPGPTMLAVFGHALAHGGKQSLPLVAGNALGALVWVAASVTGISAVLTLLPHALGVVTWLGTAYLFWLGARALTLEREEQRLVLPRSGVGRGLALAFSNPKALLFFTAVLPQFVDPSRPALGQFMVLGGTFGGLELAVTSGVALGAAGLRPFFTQPHAMRWVRRLGGLVMLLAALLLAVTSHLSSESP